MPLICFFTATRAEYFLLRPVMEQVRLDPDLELGLLVSGTHLEKDFGLTVRDIEADNFPIAARLPILSREDGPEAVCEAAGRALGTMGPTLTDLSPDLLVLLGDRYETMAAAFAAAICRVPVAHLHGGETTLGAIDNQFRHAITMMSSLHFTSTEDHRRKVVSMGADPATAFNVGALGVETARNLPPADPAELVERLGFLPDRTTLLITMHPETLSPTPLFPLQAMLAALDDLPELSLVFTKANADQGGRAINRRIREFVDARPGRAVLVDSLGQSNYLEAARRSGAVVGNSSSGVIEVPGLGTPTVNIGARQAGRPKAASVLDVPARRQAIVRAIQQVLEPDLRALADGCENPYHRPGTASRIHALIREYLRQPGDPERGNKS